MPDIHALLFDTFSTTHDVKVAPDLIDKIGLRDTDILCADKGYNSDPLRAHTEQAGCINNILRKQNNHSTNDHMDWDLYKSRHLVDNAFAKLKTAGRLRLDLISSSKVMRIR
ncbi:transposase [Psychrobacter sp. NG27]|nr:transposase [Psychrobacter sp. NG27]